jgi:hypothetical protein
MTAAYAPASFSFLTAGPSFTLALPTEFDAIPEMSSPLLNGAGGRSFVFQPSVTDEGLTPEENVLLDTISDRDGRPVDLFERVGAPPIWRLRWQLSAGALYTHLREEDGVDMARVTVSSVSVIEDDQGLPFVVAYPPLEFGASSWPGYQEEVLYSSSMRGDGYSVVFERPGALGADDAFVAERTISGGLAVIRLGLGEGVEALVTLGTDADATREAATVLRESVQVL